MADFRLVLPDVLPDHLDDHPVARLDLQRRDVPDDAAASADSQNHLVIPDLHLPAHAVVAVLAEQTLRLREDEDAVLHPRAGTAGAVLSDENRDRQAAVLLRGDGDADHREIRDVDGEGHLRDDGRGGGEGDQKP